VVGAAAGRVNEDTSEVLTVYVAPSWRRRYWGSALVDALSARCQARGVRSVQATTTTGDRVAVAFWASQGWRPAVQVFAWSLVPTRRRTWRDVTRWCRARIGVEEPNLPNRDGG